MSDERMHENAVQYDPDVCTKYVFLNRAIEDPSNVTSGIRTTTLAIHLVRKDACLLLR